MQYAVIKIPGESDIIGLVKMLDDTTIILQDPMYVIMRPSNNRMSVAFTRATLLAEENQHELSVDLDKVIGYYNPAEEICTYYEEIRSAYVTKYDAKFRKQILNDSYEEDSQRQDFLEQLRDMILSSDTANTVIH